MKHSTAVNLLDLVLAGLLIAAAIGGYRMGFLARGASWAGLIAGLLATTVTVPLALGALSAAEPLTRMGVGLVVLFLTVGAGMALGEVVGWQLRTSVQRSSLRTLDRSAGAVAGVVGLVVFVWLAAPVAAAFSPTASEQIRGSAIAGWVEGVTPAPPDTVATIQTLVDRTRFPEVFADLRPTPDTGPPPSEVPVAPDVVAAVTASTVNVESQGCDARFEGSGFTIDADRVVTNAHVVAGADVVEVRRPDGQVLAANVLTFDPARDLAVLEVPGLGQQPLPLTEAEEEWGVAIIGYPGGQNEPRVAPGAVRSIEPTVGKDIYGEQRVQRQVLFLAAELRRGDSGAAVVTQSGGVAGVVFAVSPDRATSSFALDVSELHALLAAPPNPGTGRCV
jgi:S1-C subfamily serine protease